MLQNVLLGKVDIPKSDKEINKKSEEEKDI
jgi:hypothetical protein